MIRVELSGPEVELADRVRKLVRQTGLQQQDIASLAGMDPHQLSRSLNAGRRFRVYEVARIAAATQADLSELVWGPGGPPIGGMP